jgi:hypothetical protein
MEEHIYTVYTNEPKLLKMWRMELNGKECQTE